MDLAKHAQEAACFSVHVVPKFNEIVSEFKGAFSQRRPGLHVAPLKEDFISPALLAAWPVERRILSLICP
jgi:hypothetical protein